MFCYVMIIELWLLAWNMNLVKRFDIDLAISWLWVQVLENLY